MYQNVKWGRFTLFSIICVSVIATISWTFMPGPSLWICALVILLRKPLRRWYGFRDKSEVLTDPQQIATARSQERQEDIIMMGLAGIFFVVGILFMLIDYNILPHEPLFSTPL